MNKKKKPGPKLGSAKQAKQFFVSQAYGFPNIRFEAMDGRTCSLINVPEDFAHDLLNSIKAKKVKVVS